MTVGPQPNPAPHPKPGQIAAMTARAQEHLRAGRPVQAANLLGPIMDFAGDSAPTLLVFARSLAMLRQFEAGAEAFERACGAAPDHAAARTEYAVVLSRLGRFEEALHQVRLARRSNPDFAPAVFQEADLLIDLRRDDEALDLVEANERAAPGAEQSRQDAARLCLARARLAPRRVDPNSVIDRVLAFAGDERLSVHLRCMLWVRAANLFDMLGRWDESFEAQTRAKSFQRLGWDAKTHTDRIEAGIRAWAGPEASKLKPAVSDASGIAFIVGMPRSGSTLLETMLARHPGVQPLGERNEVTSAAASVQRAPPGHMPILTDLSLLSDERLRDLSQRVRSSYESLREPGRACIVDKQPFNYAQLPFMARILPGCRVIHATRDPRDTCLSYYMQWFYGPHPQAGTVADLGRYYRDYQSMMKAWLELPAPAERPEVLEVRYERLVSDPEPVLREALAFLGLEFDPRVLERSADDRIANTASRDQIRGELSSARVERWRRFEKHLTPLDEFLGAPDPA